MVEKSGEFREACLSQNAGNGNPEPSPDLNFKIREGAETRAYARTLRYSQGKRPTPSLWETEAGDEIVQAQEKSWGPCNH